MERKIIIKFPVLVDTCLLQPNPWNPNKVAKPEMDLLRISILKSGFCFPLIVIKEHDLKYMIVDGFHRHQLALEFKMPQVPVIILDESIDELMNCTIRFNRAKGTHQIDRMSNIVAELCYLGCTDIEIAKNLGMDADEVLRLKQNSGIADIFKNHNFSNSWEITE